MSSITEAIRFCFPGTPIGLGDSHDGNRNDNARELPLYTRDESNSRQSQSQQRIQSSSSQQEALARPSTKFSVRTMLASYSFDWVLAFVLWGVLAILNRSGGHQREFSLKDTSIQHTFAVHERVPPALLVFVSVGVPLLVLIPLSTIVARNSWDTHNSILGLVMSYTMTGVVTQIIKMTVGRPRPDLINRCLPAIGAVDAPVYGLSTADICTSTNKLILDDGFKSFPSGHSSLSFAGLGFLSLYLAGKMHVFDSRGNRNRAWFALSPLLGGTMVAISRTEDNRHHWQDVLVGSLLGLFIAWVAYRTYYPRLAHRQCHLPLAPRFDLDANDDDLDGINNGAGRDSNGVVRLLSEDGNPRESEEETAWRGER